MDVKKHPYNIRYIPRAQDLLDWSFRHASKLKKKTFKKETPFYVKARIRELARIKSVSQYLVNKLTKIVKSYPSIDNLHPFYSELTREVINVDETKKALAAITGTIQVIEKITRQIKSKIKESVDPNVIGKYRISFYGRISSVIRKIDKHLILLRNYRKILVKLPFIDTAQFSVVVAGYPNVGKSSLVRLVSSASPEVSYYPFTTKKIVVGHFVHAHQKIQIIDTPGILDRPLAKRNKIELQAITALKYLANVIFFIIDPSESCGYSLESQVHLLNEIKNYFPSIPLVLFLNKIDITAPEQLGNAEKALSAETFQKIVLTSEENAPELINIIIEHMKNGTR
ncbi:MAG: NOG1 family protein [Candidatus Helarchaeota archaeon]